MAPITITAIAGLHTSPNPLDSPPGALQEAQNVVVRRKGVIESRRGFARQDENRADPTGVEPHSSFVWFKGRRVAHVASDFGIPSTGKLTWANAGIAAFTVLIGSPLLQRFPARQRLRMAEASNRLWVADRANTLAVGLSGSSLVVQPSGLRPPPDIDASASALTGASGWFSNTASAAYRYTFVVWLDGRLIESAPSGRFVITNGSGGFRNVSLNIDLPNFQLGGTPTHVRIYRSEQILPPIPTPSDELFLAVEYALTAGDLSAQTATIIDSQPEPLLGEPLYTNPITGNGILDANYPPPDGIDVALWDGRLWVANTRGPSRAEVLLVGVGAPSGLQAGDTITVFGVTLTAVAGAPAASEFQLVTGGTPAQNIEGTARNLVAAVNNLSGRPLSASYISTVDDAPGLVTFWQYTSDGTAAANVTVSRASAWQITQQTTVDPHTNGLAFSKSEQPDAFTPTNTLLVNTDAAEILRIFPLRDRLYIFKPDGIYVVSGSFPYRVDLLDGTCIILAPDALAACNGLLYALTTQGIVAVSDSGARIVSLQVEDEIRGDWQGAATGFDPSGWSVASADQWKRRTVAHSYELERLVYFWLDGNEAWVLNTMYNTWTQHFVPLQIQNTRLADAAVEPNTGRMWLMMGGNFPASDDRWWQEKKNLDRWDFGDQVGVISGIGTSDDPIDLLYITFVGIGNIQPGDVILVVEGAGNQADGAQLLVAAKIAAVSGFSNQLTLDEPLAFVIADAAGDPDVRIIIYRGIPTLITYSPITAGQPSTVKRFREATLHFTSYSIESATILAETDMAMVPAAFPQAVESPKTLWTADRDGPADAIPRENKRRLVPRDKQMGAQILISWEVMEAFCTWALCGVSVEIEGVSERNSR